MALYINSSNSTIDCVAVETLSPLADEILEKTKVLEIISTPNRLEKLSKSNIRSSLKASTWDGVLATIFGNIAGGVLISNFLLQLGATSVEIGMLSSVPMLVNLLQPLGAYLAEKTTSRHWFGLWIFAPARLIWLILAIGIGFTSWHQTNPHQLVQLTLVIVLVSSILTALGSASWFSWMAALVPERLRGRYFGLRNSAASLTNLIAAPLLGIAVSIWPRGTIEGYGVILLIGVVLGIISLIFQFFMADVNPQQQRDAHTHTGDEGETRPSFMSSFSFSSNFCKFLLYFGLWTFAVNVSSPFFNLYMLDNLAIDVKWVTLYGSLAAGANLLMLVVWGKLADKFGNRPLLIIVGLVVAITPLFWLFKGNESISIWLWLPLLHLLAGGTWAAIDLCTNNIQMSVAPAQNQCTYFAIAAAVSGVGGALGTTAGGFLAQYTDCGGLPGLFAISAILRLGALLPLVFVREQRSVPLNQIIRNFFPKKFQLISLPVAELVNRAK